MPKSRSAVKDWRMPPLMIQERLSTAMPTMTASVASRPVANLVTSAKSPICTNGAMKMLEM